MRKESRARWMVSGEDMAGGGEEAAEGVIKRTILMNAQA
jgi:hypothetical protein